jgi:LuxR family maltose regulon positive regulatory protein
MNLDSLLVSTKFAPPRLGARYIPRKQLLEQLRNAQRGTFTLVTGSAGFGKTVLLAQWRLELMKSGAVVAWLSLGHDDRQVSSFCAYLLGALKRLGIPVDDVVLDEGDSGKSLDSLVALTVNGAARIASELVLIIDDYHHVEDPWAHKLVQKLLDHCPDNLHVVIASRAAPPLGLGRLRVLDRVTEIGFEELPFDAEETRLFLEQALGSMKLSADEVRQIHDLTSGWPASVQLLAIMLKSRPSTRSRLGDIGVRSSDLQAYLAEDVVAHLPAELNEFLESMSACRRFNAELAVCITANEQAPQMVKRAEEENLLIYRVESDDSSPWYRFHPLFGEFLAARLSRRDPEVVNELHRRASRWFADHDLLVEAVRHAIRAGDLDFAVEAIEHAAPSRWSLAYVSPMLNLLERLPQETLFAHPRLFFLGCLSYSMTARHTRAETWLAKIRESEAVHNPAVSSWLALADAAIAMQHDDVQRAIDLLEPLYWRPTENRFLHYVHLTTLVSAYAVAGRSADAYRLLDDNPVPLEDRRNDLALVYEGTRATTLLVEGRVQEAARLGAMLLARSEAAHGRRSICANLCAATLAAAYYELDQIDDAREVLANRTGILQSSAPGVMVSAALCRARLDHLQESPEAALEFVRTHGAHYRSQRLDRPVAYMLAEEIRILLAKGERGRAGELSAQLDGLAAQHRDAVASRAEIPALAALTHARMSMAENDAKEALRWLAQVQEHAERYGRRRSLVLARVLSALALDDLGRADEAANVLAEAVELGARLGLVRTFVDEGKRVAEMLARLRQGAGLEGALAQYADALLARFGSAGHALPQSEGAAPASRPAAETASLTPRELEILGLISQAMSNKRIALTLNITLETVKWNVKNILAKLGVSSRYDAMTWARKKGLIE